QQLPPGGPGRRPGDVPPQGLRRGRPPETTDARRRGVPAPLRAARVAAGVRQGAALWPLGQWSAPRPAECVPALAAGGNRSGGRAGCSPGAGGAGPAALLSGVRRREAGLPGTDAGGERRGPGGQLVSPGGRARRPPGCRTGQARRPRPRCARRAVAPHRGPATDLGPGPAAPTPRCPRLAGPPRARPENACQPCEGIASLPPPRAAAGRIPIGAGAAVQFNWILSGVLRPAGPLPGGVVAGGALRIESLTFGCDTMSSMELWG